MFTFMVAVVSCLLPGLTEASLVVNIDTNSAIHTVDERYLSVTLDQNRLKATPKFGPFDFKSTRIRTLLRGLSPAYLRFGGTTTDSVVFSETPRDVLRGSKVIPEMNALSKQDLDNFLDILSSVGDYRFLLELSVQLRYGVQWDPSNAMQLLDYLANNKDAGLVDFEMGNEPNHFPIHPGWLAVTPQQMAQDYQVLRRVLDLYPAFRSSLLMGPDCSSDVSFYKDFVLAAASNLSAATWHHYYMSGPDASYKDYIDPKNFDKLKTAIKDSLDPVKKSSKPDMPIWIGETSDAYGSGTVNVSDRFVSGFLWMDKLGLSASMGIKAVFRQAFYGGHYTLMSADQFPRPDYWLSYVFKKLVGLKVLKTTIASSTLFFRPPQNEALYFDSEAKPDSLRVYAHCTAEGGQYKNGSITIFGLNVHENTTVTLKRPSGLENLPLHQYLMTPEGADGVLSKYVLLNGKRLEMPNNTTLPALQPEVLPVGAAMTLPPLSYGYFVIPDAAAKACMG